MKDMTVEEVLALLEERLQYSRLAEGEIRWMHKM